MTTSSTPIRVTVLAGGTSAEREISLRSGAAVAAALEHAGHHVQLVDPAEADMLQIIDCDVVFPALHGAGGEDGSIQAQLDTHGARYVGSDYNASHLCFDKWMYRTVATDAGLPVADGALVQTDTFTGHPLTRSAFVLKPVSGGSSIATHIVRDPAQMTEQALLETLQEYQTMLLEQLIVGIELTVGVLGDTALPVIEIIPPDHGDFSYENKYNGRTQELCPAQHVSEAIQERAQELAVRAHKLMGCRDLSRTDIMYETATDRLYLLETNTIPGMTEASLFPKMTATRGKEMHLLVDELVQMALTR